MSHPPSLSPAVPARSFRAANGELGLLPADVVVFLDACQVDGLGVLGWELWLADHEWDAPSGKPRPAPGRWCGLIPARHAPEPAVFHGSGDNDAVRLQIAALDLDALVEPLWLPYIRLNITIDD